jgi:integrase
LRAPEPYTPEEVAAILQACDEFGRQPYERLRARALILLLRYTALRIGDALQLRRDQVRDGRLEIRAEKNGEPVRLPVPPRLAKALDAVPLPRGAPPGCPYYFWNGVGSVRALKNDGHRMLDAVFRKSGVRDAHSHRFRHTLATEILSKGGSEQDVADVLGISPAIVRKHYAKWSQARQERISQIMQAVHGLGTTWAQTEKRPIIQ